MTRRLRILLAAVASFGAIAAFARPAPAASILFVGNSFTFGAFSPVQRYHPDRVTDLNGDGNGGVPALFATFAREAGQSWEVSHETSPGKTLAWHYANRAPVLAARPYDVVILQGYSTLNPVMPGDPAEHIQGARDLAHLFRQVNPAVKINLVTTWPRADQVYLETGHWHGQGLDRMYGDLAAASAAALQQIPELNGAIPVGAAWTRAMHEGLADDNPFDGVAFGKLDLWTWDQYHGSAAGYYLEALMVFGQVTGVDPLTLGLREQAADDLGLSSAQAEALQRIAHEELVAAGRLATPQVQAAAPAPAARR